MADAVKSSEDTFIGYFVDEYTDEATGTAYEEAIDLSGSTCYLIVVVNGTSKKLALTPDGDQVTNKGKASALLTSAFFSVGSLKGQLYYQDTGGSEHWSELFYIDVEDSIAVPA